SARLDHHRLARRSADAEAALRGVGRELDADRDGVLRLGREAGELPLQEHEQVVATVEAREQDPAAVLVQRLRQRLVPGDELVRLLFAGRVVGEAGGPTVRAAVELELEDAVLAVGTRRVVLAGEDRRESQQDRCELRSHRLVLPFHAWTGPRPAPRPSFRPNAPAGIGVTSASGAREAADDAHGEWGGASGAPSAQRQCSRISSARGPKPSAYSPG